MRQRREIFHSSNSNICNNKINGNSGELLRGENFERANFGSELPRGFSVILNRIFFACCSGVAVSCGECSSSGTSDITEPGSPCSTSSDEGVAAIRGTSASPLPSLPKLAPSSQLGTRPQWPWTPPLAATACSTTAFKRLRGEPEAGALPRSGAADPTSRGAVKGNGKTAGGQHHESQGKITEYFKTQIKPQQPKVGVCTRQIINVSRKAVWTLCEKTKMSEGDEFLGHSSSLFVKNEFLIITCPAL